ncbi:MAG: DNA alkylation repair protein [Bacteroidetes bacterium]|nr:MAG: DNA alkylation repair protein [Bacteroidota bacterium]
MKKIKIPDAPNSIQKGVPLKNLLGEEAVVQLGKNIRCVYPEFESSAFVKASLEDIEPLGIMDRGRHIAIKMRDYLPKNYSDAIAILLKSLTPPLEKTEDNGLAGLFYMPHNSFVSEFGLDDFETSIKAQYELTKRFTCEYPIRPFIKKYEKRTMETLYSWMYDEDPHVRRLCSEGTRPRLPWSTKIDAFVKDPTPSIQILEHLKNDPDLYVRRSVANHVGDIAKDHLDLALDLCENWLDGASAELKWVIRHAVRNPIKKGNERAVELRFKAK